MILKPEQWRIRVGIDCETLETLDALTQTNAELTAKLDAVREVVKELDALSWSDTEGERLARSILSILDAPTKPKEARNER